MAKRKTNLNKLARKFGKKWKDSREKEAVQGGDLPGGIKGGIAKIQTMKIDEYDDGTQYAAIVGKVIFPEEHTGKTAYKKYVFKDRSNKSAEEVLDKFCNDCKLLGIDVSEYDVEDLNDMCTEAEDSGIFYYFDTKDWEMEVKEKGKKKTITGVAVFIGRALEDHEIPDTVEGESMSLAKMAQLADDGNRTYMDALEDLAGEYSIDPEDFETYAQLVDEFPDEEEADEVDEEESEEDVDEESDESPGSYDTVPEEGDECYYGGDLVTVASVDEDNDTCVVVDDGGGEWEDVPFSELEWDEE